MTITDDKISIIKKQDVQDAFVVMLHDNGIVEVVWSKEIMQVEKRHVAALKEIIKDFGNGKKMLVYISTIDFLNISSEARDYSSSEEGEEFTFANAVQVDKLAKRIAFNFYMRVNKPKRPTKAFTNREDAIRWLLGLKNGSL